MGVGKVSAQNRIKQLIKGDIHSGRLREGDRVTSEYELVRQLSVTRSQARQALRELEIEGYVVRRQGSGSFVAPNAGKAGGTVAEVPRTVAVAFPTYNSAYIRDVVESFMETLFAAGYGVTSFNLQVDEPAEVRFLKDVPRSGIVGLLVWLGNETEKVRDALREIGERGFPVVMADRYYPDVEIDYVVSDNDEVGHILTEALISRGHARVACIASAEDLATSQLGRVGGYRRAIREASGHSEPARIAEVDALVPESFVAIDRLMAHREHPTGLVCINDILAGMVADRVRELGYSVPGDLEVATVDDGAFTGTEPVRAVTVRQNGTEVGRRSGKALMARLKDCSLPAQHHIVEPGPAVESVLTARGRGATGKRGDAGIAVAG